MTKNEITIADIRFEVKQINGDLDAFLEACQQEEEAYGCHQSAVIAKRGYKRFLWERWQEVGKLILALDIHSK